jgi:hypothetical protein
MPPSIKSTGPLASASAKGITESSRYGIVVPHLWAEAHTTMLI